MPLVFSISSQKMRKITLALQFCDRVIFSCLFLVDLLYWLETFESELAKK